jgi:integrase
MPYKEGRIWRAVVTFNGRRYTKFFEKKGGAKIWETEKRKSLKKDWELQRDGICLSEFCSKYLEFSNNLFRPKVYDEKKTICKRIQKEWGPGINVESITPEMAEEYLLKQMKKRSANSANKDRKNLKAMWTKGIKTYGVKSNPFRDTEKFPHDIKPQYTPSVEDVLKLLMVADRVERVFLDCYIQTGARRSEIFRLLWEDVNFDNRSIRLGTRKTKDRSMKYRSVEMSDSLYDSLWWWWENRTFKDKPYVFVDNRNGPHYGKPYKVRGHFMLGLCKRAGIKPFGFHALRRFTASVLDSKNVPLTKIQHILGHSRATTTDRYLQDINRGKQGVMNLISEEIHVNHTRDKNKGTQNYS